MTKPKPKKGTKHPVFVVGDRPRFRNVSLSEIMRSGIIPIWDFKSHLWCAGSATGILDLMSVVKTVPIIFIYPNLVLSLDFPVKLLDQPTF